LGRVKSLARQSGFYFKEECYLKGFIKPEGYCCVDLSISGKKKKYYRHRLVAEAFIPNPNNYPEVNHKDEDKSNNRVDNLEWITTKENLNYGTHNKRARLSNINNPLKSKKINQFDLDGNFINTYPSANEIERQTGFHATSIIRCCKGHYNVKTCKGFIWKYEEGVGELSVNTELK